MQVGAGPSTSVEFHVVADAEQNTLTIRPKGSPPDMAVLVRTEEGGRRTVTLLGADAKATYNSLHASTNESIRKLASFLDSPILMNARGGSPIDGLVPFAIRDPRSWSGFDPAGGVVRTQGSVVSFETARRGSRRSISVDTTIGLPVAQRVERADGSLVEVSQQFSPITPELVARSSARVRVRPRGEQTDRIVTLSIANLRLTGRSGS